MTAEQLALDCEPDWNDDEFDEADLIPTDLHGQGLPYDARIDDIHLTGSHL